MEKNSEDFLYRLLPAIYHIRDKEQGYPLRAFLHILSREADIIKDDIRHLYENFFIDTCDDWIIPYIGDLIGVTPLHEVTQSNRVDVAKTIYYRRRKGTLPMLEELADDVTGWNCHAIPFFSLLLWTQNLNHQRYQLSFDISTDKQNPCALNSVGTVHLRNTNALDKLNGPFDVISHTIDVRSNRQNEGWYNIKNIGFFLWRLRSYRLSQVRARQSKTHMGCYHFSPLGNPLPLFKRHDPETNEMGITKEINIQGPIRPIDFYFHTHDYYGKDKSIYIEKVKGQNKSAISNDEIICKNLKTWNRPPKNKVAIDVYRGRIAFAETDPMPDYLIVSFWYGFSTNLGGVSTIDNQQW